MAEEPPHDTTFEEFEGELDGVMVQPRQRGFDETREIWNGRLVDSPAVIARCRSSTDVVAAVTFASDEGLPVAVKSGGHDYAGLSSPGEGLLIDVSAIDHVSVDPEARRATVGPGASWGDLDESTQAHGLATTGVTVSTVGVAGATLGGGTGHLARTQGLALDNVASLEVATAGGDLVEASEDTNPDLFWALRGGRGNFGVVTEFEFQLHEVGSEVVAGQAMHPIDDVIAVLEFYREFAADMPDALTCYAFVIPIPPLEAFPEEIYGDPAITLVASYVGPTSAGEAAIEPLREFGDPLFADFGPMPYTALQSMFDDGVPEGQRWYSRAHYIDEITDEAIDMVAEYAGDLHGPMTMAYVEPLGGAIAEIDSNETAFPHRDAKYSFHILCGWMDAGRDQEMQAWTDAFYEAMEPHARGGVYVNLLNEDEAERVPAAYGENYERLQRVKADWDPDNVFSLSHNIEPATE